MKGSKVILALVALVILFGASALRAQSDYCWPLTKAIGPGVNAVKYSTVTYFFRCDDYFTVKLEKLDTVHVKVTIKPVKQEPRPYAEVVVQLGTLPGAELQVDWPAGNAYIFNTETGYAEK